MLKPIKSIKSLKHQDSTCRDSLNILCWNIAKLSQKKEFKNYLDMIIKEHQIDVLLLQEVKERLTHEISLKEYSYVISPNMETSKHIFGVLSAFKFSCVGERSLLTSSQELKYMTHKSTLITLHETSEKEELMIVNLHAINFVSAKDFKSELEYIKSEIGSFKGAMIVAGDFNTWSLKRVKYLKEFADELELKEVLFEDKRHIKKVFRKQLDYIFYRTLHVEYSTVINCDSFSDHNPLIVSFKL